MRLLVDVSGLAYYATWFNMKSSKFDAYSAAGEMLRSLTIYTSGFGFRPSEIILAFDGGKDARLAIYPEYKGQRDQNDPLRLNVKETLKVFQAAMAYLPVVSIMVPGIEADDVIAHLVLSRFMTPPTTIMSRDLDLWQLTRRSGVFLMDFKGIMAEPALPPAQHLAYKVLVGDTSDHIKGVLGVGDKTALALLEKHKSLRGIADWARTDKSRKLGRMTWKEAKPIIQRNLKLMKLDGKLMTEEQLASVEQQYIEGRAERQINAKALVHALKARDVFEVEDITNTFSFLMPQRIVRRHRHKRG